MWFKSIFAFIAVFLFLMPHEVNAYPGGLLNGMEAVVVPGGTTKNLTDGNDSTKQSIYKNSVTFTLPKTADLTRIRANVTYRMNGTFRVGFYSDSGVLIAQKSGFGIGTLDYPVDFKSVRKIVLDAALGGDGWNTDLAEFDVFGSYQLPRPDNLQVVPDIKSLKITFNEVPKATGYLLYVDGQKFRELTTNEYIMTDLIPDKVYSIKLTSVFPDGESGFSKEVQAAPYAEVINPVLKVTSTAWNSVGLAWTKPNGSSREVVYQDGTVAEGNFGNGSFVFKAKPDKKYKFVVTMYDKYGRFLSTNAVNVTTPLPVTDTAQEEGPDFLLVNWQKTEGATGYRIYLNGRLIGSVGPSIFEYKITRAMGYIPGAIANKAEARAILADGTEGNSNNPTAPVLDLGGGFGVLDAVKAGLEFVKLFNGWVLVSLAIVLANMVIAFMYLINKKTKKQGG
ncbi:hypothetical protein [Paenibacillus sp. DRB1-1]|uniref:hypothetical protein n=1 Tax=Paenibacillus sp. DRB1-1 TaxID=3422309 RepID=UPI003F9E3020